MVLYIKIGRRIPRAWRTRVLQKGKGLLTFQENIWMMISRALSMAKKKANEANTLSFVKKTEYEPEDLNWQFEWITIIINGTPEQEEEEYNESMKLYDQLGKVFTKQEMPSDPNLKKQFKTKKLNFIKLEEAYKEGHGTVKDKSISAKLLELGIVTHIEWDKTFEHDAVHGDLEDIKKDQKVEFEDDDE